MHEARYFHAHLYFKQTISQIGRLRFSYKRGDMDDYFSKVINQNFSVDILHKNNINVSVDISMGSSVKLTFNCLHNDQSF